MPKQKAPPERAVERITLAAKHGGAQAPAAKPAAAAQENPDPKETGDADDA